MILEIVKYGHPALRAKGKTIAKIDAKIEKLADDMLETMYDAHGVGLAAQQVGVPLQLTVIDVADAEERPSKMWVGGKEVELEEWMPMALINPQVELEKEREEGTEGCLSFPEITASILRARRVKVKALDLAGEPLEFEAEGLLARAVQHEVDHLHGILFIDRMNSATKASLANRLKKMHRQNER